MFPLAFRLLRVPALPLEHAPVSAWLTPICPSGLDLDTLSFRKPSLMPPG